MEPAALPAARMTRRPDPGGGGRCAGRQFAGCAAATAVRNRSSRKLRGGTVKMRAQLSKATEGQGPDCLPCVEFVIPCRAASKARQHRRWKPGAAVTILSAGRGPALDRKSTRLN